MPNINEQVIISGRVVGQWEEKTSALGFRSRSATMTTVQVELADKTKINVDISNLAPSPENRNSTP